MNCDTAILIVSFGTMHVETLERCITATEKAIAESFPEYPVYRAFLNPTVIRKLQECHDLQTDSPAEALARMKRDGCRQAVVQPTLLLQGLEYERLAKECEKAGIPIALGRPLLANLQDCRALASVLMEENPLEEKEALVLMGHGTEGGANEIYSVLQQTFDDKEYPAFIATMSGKPSFADAAERLVRWGAQRARLLPLMFVAGGHAMNNMAGERDSLLSVVREAGVVPEAVFRGLGESRKVQAIYVERVREALKSLSADV